MCDKVALVVREVRGKKRIGISAGDSECNLDDVLENSNPECMESITKGYNPDEYDDGEVVDMVDPYQYEECR